MNNTSFCFILGFTCVLIKFTFVVGYDSTHETFHSGLSDSEFVDPNSLYYKPNVKAINDPNIHTNLQYLHDYNSQSIAVRNNLKKSDECLEYSKDSSYEVFSRRLINILITKSNLKVIDDLHVGHLNIKATNKQLEVLKDFGKGKISFRQLDGIISDVIQPIPVDFAEEVFNFADHLSISIYEHRIIFGTLLVGLFVLIIALKVEWTRWRIILLIFDIIVVISFVLTWWELVQESEIKLMASRAIYSKMPEECKQNELGFLKTVYLFFGFGKGDCIKYFEAIMTDPVLKVTPFQAFSHMCSKVLYVPLIQGAHYLSEFIEIMTQNLPWFLKYPVIIILSILLPISMIGLLFIYSGGAAGLRVGPFFHVYLHGRQTMPTENSVAYNDTRAIEVIRSDTREALKSPKTKEHSPNSPSNKKNIPTKMKISSQTDDSNFIRTERGEKVEESDTNSDEFSEEKEFEKISKKKVEDEINQAGSTKLSKKKKINEDYVSDKPSKVSKESLEIDTTIFSSDL